MLFWVTVIFWTWPAAEEWSKGLQKKKKKKISNHGLEPARIA